MFTDSHCHLNRLDLTAHEGELSSVIDAMKAANVSRAMAIMCDFAEHDTIKNIVDTYGDETLNLGMSVGWILSGSINRLVDRSARKAA